MGLIIISSVFGILDAFFVDGIVDADDEAGRLQNVFRNTGTRVELILIC